MCIGLPMQIIEQYEHSARCRGRDGERIISTLLIGPQEEGVWVLNSLGHAREVISEEEAAKIEDALAAVEAVMRGEELDVDSYFPDLATGRRVVEPPEGK
ncbi:MAG: HypC/HybG/HupF family hydrogenase formation chaperone [Sedimenticola sp.]